jgi:hypothetical protein
VKQAAIHAKLNWRQTNYLLLRRGPYVIAAGLDESIPGQPKELRGRFADLFDPELRVRRGVTLAPGARFFLLDLDAAELKKARVLASACKALPLKKDIHSLTLAVEGVAGTPAIVLLSAPEPPRAVTLAGQPCGQCQYSASERLLWVRFPNESSPRELRLEF